MSKRTVCGPAEPAPIVDKDGKETGTFEAPISESLAAEAATAKSKAANKRTEREKKLADVAVTAATVEDPKPIEADGREVHRG